MAADKRASEREAAAEKRATEREVAAESRASEREVVLEKRASEREAAVAERERVLAAEAAQKTEELTAREKDVEGAEGRLARWAQQLDVMSQQVGDGCVVQPHRLPIQTSCLMLSLRTRL